jgi:hypothetical protein
VGGGWEGVDVVEWGMVPIKVYSFDDISMS